MRDPREKRPGAGDGLEMKRLAILLIVGLLAATASAVVALEIAGRVLRLEH